MDPQKLWFVFRVFEDASEADYEIEYYEVGRYGAFAGCSEVVFCSNDKRLARRMAEHFKVSGGKI